MTAAKSRPGSGNQRKLPSAISGYMPGRALGVVQSAGSGYASNYRRKPMLWVKLLNVQKPLVIEIVGRGPTRTEVMAEYGVERWYISTALTEAPPAEERFVVWNLHDESLYESWFKTLPEDKKMTMAKLNSSSLLGKGKKTSTVSYMLAFLFSELATPTLYAGFVRPRRVHLNGIDLRGVRERSHQRDSLLYWVGALEIGLGITVTHSNPAMFEFGDYLT